MITSTTVAVVGLGYVGLPLAVHAAMKGHDVAGIDVNPRLVESVNNRKSPFVNDARLTARLAGVPNERLHASTSFDALDRAGTIIICVPTPTNDNVPDLSYVLAAVKEIAPRLHRGQLVILESTVNPGVTRDDVLPVLEQESGLVCGRDFYLAHCPERIDPGNAELYVGNINRVVGGTTEECTKRAHKFYSSIIDARIVPLGSAEEAEFVKSWENTHRNVLIALANEAAVICNALGMDIDNVLKGLQSKVDQFGLKLAKPGIGPGGHCIPEDIHYVIKKARQNGIDTRLLDSAADLNDRMPRFAVGELQKLVLEKGEDLAQLNVALLGLAYKENIGDARRSPAIDVAHLLLQRARSVTVHDPYVDLDRLGIRGVSVEHDLAKALRTADAVFVATPHDQYRRLTSDDFARHGVRYVLDGRNALDRQGFAKADVSYQGIGR